MYRCLTVDNLSRLCGINGLLMLFDHINTFNNRPVASPVDAENLTDSSPILTSDNLYLIVYSQACLSLPHYRSPSLS
jgi:hypothetical protein